jgi:hypothetical protein
MAKGMLFHVCCGQAHAFDATRKAVEFWLADYDPLSSASDVQEWIRRCAKVRDEVVSLQQKTARLAMTDPVEKFPAGGAAFLVAMEAAMDILAVVGHAVHRLQQGGQRIENAADFERIVKEVAQTQERFAAKYPELDPASIAPELAAYQSAPAANAPQSAADTVGELRLSQSSTPRQSSSPQPAPPARSA